MRVLQVSHNYHIVGGSDAVFFATCDLLSAVGHDVIPFCIDSPKNRPTRWQKYFPHAADSRGAPISDGVRYFFNRDARAQLNRLLDEVGPVDVAHLHIYHGKQTPAILPVLRARGIPVVHTLHEYKMACPVYTMLRQGQPCDLCVQGSDLNSIRYACKDGSYLRSLVMVTEKATARLLGDVRLVDRFLCVSDFQRQIMARAGLPKDRLHLLHNFVATAARPEPGHGGYFLYFGRIEKLKGIVTMLKAFDRTNHRLLIAGNGGWSRELRAAISTVKNIEFLGFQTGRNLTRLIRRAKAVIVPSQWYENCPMSVLEAKAHGRPVIAANIGGVPELVRHGTDGVLFEPGDVGGLIAAIDQIGGANYETLAMNARSDAIARFSAPVHLKQLLAHYAQVSDYAPNLAFQGA